MQKEIILGKDTQLHLTFDVSRPTTILPSKWAIKRTSNSVFYQSINLLIILLTGAVLEGIPSSLGICMSMPALCGHVTDQQRRGKSNPSQGHYAHKVCIFRDAQRFPFILKRCISGGADTGDTSCKDLYHSSHLVQAFWIWDDKYPKASLQFFYCYLQP